MPENDLMGFTGRIFDQRRTSSSRRVSWLRLCFGCHRRGRSDLSKQIGSRLSSPVSLRLANHAISIIASLSTRRHRCLTGMSELSLLGGAADSPERASSFRPSAAARRTWLRSRHARLIPMRTHVLLFYAHNELLIIAHPKTGGATLSMPGPISAS
jgi:hypothetical protein